MTPTQARQAVAALEAQLGCRLHEHPVANVDQWTARMRDVAAELGADLADPQQAQAAFAGAYMLFTAIVTNGPVLAYQAVTAAHTMRVLVDRADQAPEAEHVEVTLRPVGETLRVAWYAKPRSWWRRWWR